jgi:DNA repair protein RecO (recombination protein O)
MTQTSDFRTPAIILRRIEHGDYDLIITFMTLDQGKITVIAKHARKSTKRFSGILELFALLQIVCTKGRGSMPLLKEATLKQPHFQIRKNIMKTAYASYWTEIANEWLEEGKTQTDLFHLLAHSFDALDSDSVPDGNASIFFQTRFLKAAGLSPNLSECHVCKTKLDELPGKTLDINLPGGGIVCSTCGRGTGGLRKISKGAVKQLLWMGKGNEDTAARVRLSPTELSQNLDFLDRFVSYHLGKDLKSLKFLREMRQSDF